MRFIDKFLCIASAVVITSVEFVTDKLMLSEYMMRVRDGTINEIVKSIIMFISLIIFAVATLTFMRYSNLEFENRTRSGVKYYTRKND